MLDRAQIDQVYPDGFLVVPQVIGASEIASLRTDLDCQFRNTSNYPSDANGGDVRHSIRVDLCARFPQFRWLLTHEPIISSAQSLLDADAVVLPEVVAHESGYGPWHKDITSQERDDHQFHWEDPNFAMLEAAIYLQDNGPDRGGGALDVIPGSHKIPDRYSTLPTRLINKLRQKGRWPDHADRFSIPSKAGDLVLFHFKLDHRATPPRKAHLGSTQRKLAIFIAFSRRNESAFLRYVDYVKTRPSYACLGNHSYPDDYREKVESRGLKLL